MKKVKPEDYRRLSGEKKAYVRTVLECYGRSNAAIDFIDRNVEEIAYNSHGCIYDSRIPVQNAFNQVEMIVRLIQKGENIRYLVRTVDKALLWLDEYAVAVLFSRFVKGKSVRLTAEQLKLNGSECSRILKTAVVGLYNELKYGEHDLAWFKDNYFDQAWIKRRFSQNLKKQRVIATDGENASK